MFKYSSWSLGLAQDTIDGKTTFVRCADPIKGRSVDLTFSDDLHVEERAHIINAVCVALRDLYVQRVCGDTEHERA